MTRAGRNGPFLHSNCPDRANPLYKVMVRVKTGEQDARYKVFVNHDLILHLTDIAKLPETMRWNLTCLIANADFTQPVNENTFPDLLWETRFAQKGWEDIGWRMNGKHVVVIVPESELVSLIMQYNRSSNGDTGIESQSQG